MTPKPRNTGGEPLASPPRAQGDALFQRALPLARGQTLQGGPGRSRPFPSRHGVARREGSWTGRGEGRGRTGLGGGPRPQPPPPLAQGDAPSPHRPAPPRPTSALTFPGRRPGGSGAGGRAVPVLCGNRLSRSAALRCAPTVPGRLAGSSQSRHASAGARAHRPIRGGGCLPLPAPSARSSQSAGSAGPTPPPPAPPPPPSRPVTLLRPIGDALRASRAFPRAPGQSASTSMRPSPPANHRRPPLAPNSRLRPPRLLRSAQAQ